MASIYCITDMEGSFTYVNSADDFTTAISVHLKLLEVGKHPVIEMQKVYDVMGGEFLMFSEISKVSDKKRAVKELAYKAAFGNMN